MATTNCSNADTKKDAFGGMNIPKVDTNALLDSYKKNLEILGLINKMSIEVCSGIAKLQSAFVKQFITDMGGVAEKSGKPADAFAKLSDVIRDSVVKAIENNKQISDLITASNNELTSAITKRFKDFTDAAKSSAAA